MTISKKIQQAINKAAELHINQVRKGYSDNPIPYITHPFSVAYIISKYTSDEATIIAALLHDVLEDVKKEVYSHEQMIRDFGVEVYEIVKGVSEDKDATITKEEETRTWITRKEKYIQHLYKDSDHSLMVCCGDKIHNITSLCEIYEKSSNKEIALDSFNAPIDKKVNILWHYEEVYRVMSDKFHNPIVNELGEAVKNLKRVFST
ncbi:MAG: HD domain-containing protein [Candidatus Roizmanbacteria bacterium]|nr:HD domain-containing protein [Candidatus Roizmanbacteria bacterium]